MRSVCECRCETGLVAGCREEDDSRAPRMDSVGIGLWSSQSGVRNARQQSSFVNSASKVQGIGSWESLKTAILRPCSSLQAEFMQS